MQIGKVVGSNSHTEYLCQIIKNDENAILPGHYALGNFLIAGSAPGEETRGSEVSGNGASGMVGVVTDTKLVDPAYARFGLRTLPEDDLSLISPDYLDERMTLISIIPVGKISSGEANHGIPAESIPLGTPVFTLDDNAIRSFHLPGDRFRMAYFGDLPRSGSCALALRRNILLRLKNLLPGHCAALEVMLKSMEWQRLEGGR